MNDKIKCPICGTEMIDMDFEDCPYCDWTYIGIESVCDPDESISGNPVTIRQARENVKRGLNVWGDPLPKKE